jgi:hypothetical protein
MQGRGQIDEKTPTVEHAGSPSAVKHRTHFEINVDTVEAMRGHEGCDRIDERFFSAGEPCVGVEPHVPAAERNQHALALRLQAPDHRQRGCKLARHDQ